MWYRIQARAIGPLLRRQQILCAMVEQQNDLGGDGFLLRIGKRL